MGELRYTQILKIQVPVRGVRSGYGDQRREQICGLGPSRKAAQKRWGKRIKGVPGLAQRRPARPAPEAESVPHLPLRCWGSGSALGQLLGCKYWAGHWGSTEIEEYGGYWGEISLETLPL